MRKLLTLAIIFCMVTTGLPIITPNSVHAATQVEYYISETGSDSNPGTLTQPFGSIQKARDVIRTINSNMTGDIIVYLRGGTYYLTDTLTFNESDSGTNGYKVIYRNYPGEGVLISGGSRITGWTQEENSPLWKASVSVDNFRQLYVNGKRVQRARSEKTFTGLSWYKGSFSSQDGICVSDDVIGNYENPGDIDLVWSMYWRYFIHNVDSIQSGSANQKIIKMKQPYFSWGTQMTNDGAYAFRPDYTNPFYIENAFELLNEPGEWYLNRSTDTVYYWPKADEDMSTVEVYAPAVETILKISGSSIENKVHDITFTGLIFKYGSWLRPSQKGFASTQAEALTNHVFHQSNVYADTDIVPGNIQIDAASNIVFENNQFKHMGAVAIQLINGVNNAIIRGNYFYDISDAAVEVGLPSHAYIDQPNEEVCKDNIINNNLIRSTGQEFLSAPGITAFFVDGLQITHNDLADMPYSGISVGWGWQFYTDSRTCRNNVISYNKISDYMKKLEDGGAIYTLGQQPGSSCSGNYIRETYGRHGGIYHDDGSAFYTTSNNVIDNKNNWIFIWNPSIHEISVSNNYVRINKYRNQGINCAITGTVEVSNLDWPQGALDIMSNSGIESSYRYLNAFMEKSKDNLALGKPAVALLPDGSMPPMHSGREADKAVDGDLSTWAQTSSGYVWTEQVDLESIENISKIVVNFPVNPPAAENLFATEFNIKVGTTTSSSITVASITGCTGGRKEVNFIPIPARYISIEAVKPDGPNQTGSQMGISELEVYAEANLALGKSAAAFYPNGSPAYMWPEHEAGKATDGNPLTYAQATGSYVWTEQVDMGLTKTINRFAVNFSNDPLLYATEFNIKTSIDGTSWRTATSVTGCNGGRYESRFKPVSARYVRIEAVKPDNGGQVGGQMAITEVEVYADTNLAAGKPATAYYIDGNTATMHNGREADKAVDGNDTTWAQATGSYKWIEQIDLQAVEKVSTVVVNFPTNPPASETLYATDYNIKVGTTASSLITVASVTGCSGGRNEIKFTPIPARYVRIEAVKPDGPDQTGSQMGISELEVYNTATAAPALLSQLYPPEGMFLHLKADFGVCRDSDGHVRDWKSPLAAGGGNNAARYATQHISGNSPEFAASEINGKPTLVFDGNDDYIDSMDTFGNLSSFTVAFVMKSTTNVDCNILGAAGGWGQFQFSSSNNGGVYVGTDLATRIVPNDGPGAGTIAAGSAQVFVYTYGNGTGKLYRNGTLLATKTQTAPNAWSGFRLGSSSGTSISGDLPELCIYANVLSDADRTNLINYLMSKYGIQ